ncbi:MAG: hypothetical protein ABI868_10985 [Acidobacteriota bacterium]
MSILLRPIVLCLALSELGCGVAKVWLGYERTVRNAHADLRLAKEFAALYPQATEGITYFSSDKPAWRSEAGIHDRYCLSLRLPITISASWTHSSPAGEPHFFLAEVAFVQRLSGNQFSISYGKTHKEFGLPEWNTLVKSHGDLSTLGIEVIKDKPIADFANVPC